MEKFSLRMALSEELQELVTIDNEASELYAKAGLSLKLADNHPFVVAESRRWTNAIKQGLAHVAVNSQDKPIGFVTLATVDGQPYLDQITVLLGYMRRGVGTLLLNHAISWSGARPLWLTTYAHLPWNRAYYERHGFITIAESECGAELCAILDQQRSVLPDPEQRIAMVRRCSSGGT